jgi:hypothetical protein
VVHLLTALPVSSSAATVSAVLLAAVAASLAEPAVVELVVAATSLLAVHSCQ